MEVVRPVVDVGDAFAAIAQAVCDSALKEKQSWYPLPVSGFNLTAPDATKLPLVAAWLHDEVAPTFEAWRNGLVALGDPRSGQGAWHDLLDAVKGIAQANDDQIAAAKDGDVEAFTSATQRLNQLQPALATAADSAGVSGCADVHAA